MTKTSRSTVAVLILSGWTLLAFGADVTTEGPAVKKSASDICHARGTAYYEQTRPFTPYDSMEACLESGGRYPKGQEPGAGPPVKKSKNGICHDRSSPSYGHTEKFTPFQTMEECLKSGGRRPKTNQEKRQSLVPSGSPPEPLAVVRSSSGQLNERGSKTAMKPAVTSHAAIRMQQRVVPPLIVAWLQAYGTECYDKHGGVKLYSDTAARRRMERELGRIAVRQMARFLDAYRVKAEGAVVTVGRRTQRIHRY